MSASQAKISDASSAALQKTSESIAVSLRDQVLNCFVPAERKSSVLPVPVQYRPNPDVDFFVRPLSVPALHAYNERMLSCDNKRLFSPISQAMIIVHSICDADGNMLLTEADLPQLMGNDALGPSLEKLSSFLFVLNGIMNNDVINADIVKATTKN